MTGVIWFFTGAAWGVLCIFALLLFLAKRPKPTTSRPDYPAAVDVATTYFWGIMANGDVGSQKLASKALQKIEDLMEVRNA